MSKLKNIVHIGKEDFGTLVSEGSVTVNGVTLDYDTSGTTEYVIEDDDPPEYAVRAEYAVIAGRANYAERASRDRYGKDIVSDKEYLYEWVIPSTVVTVNHGLGKYPAVTVVDTAGSEIVCDVRHIDLNNVELSFSAPMRGKAFFN